MIFGCRRPRRRGIELPTGRLSEFVNATLNQRRHGSRFSACMISVADVHDVTMRGDALICAAPFGSGRFHEELQRTAGARDLRGCRVEPCRFNVAGGR